MILETKRLLLRPYVESDFEAVHSYASVYENVKYMVWGPNSEEDTQNFLRVAIDSAKAVPQLDFEFAVTLKENGKVIGGCGIGRTASLDEGSLGWILHRDYWKQGYGTEFAQELLRFGFEDLKLHRICATCYANNYGSYRVMEHNGMRREGCFLKCRPGRPCDGEKWYDEFHYALLEEEWRANKTNR